MALTSMPRKIVLFERLGYSTVLVGSAASTWANWGSIGHFYLQYPLAYPLLLVISVAVQAGWVWMIARKRQSWARWPSVIVTALAILMLVANAKTMLQANPVATAVNAAIYLLWTIELSLLFTREAKAWFVFPASPVVEAEPLPQTEG